MYKLVEGLRCLNPKSIATLRVVQPAGMWMGGRVGLANGIESSARGVHVSRINYPDRVYYQLNWG